MKVGNTDIGNPKNTRTYKYLKYGKEGWMKDISELPEHISKEQTEKRKSSDGRPYGAIVAEFD